MNDLLYGFHSLADVLDRRVGDYQIERLNTAVVQALGEYNRQRAATRQLFLSQTQKASELYVVAQNTGSLQPLDEFARAEPTQDVISEYTVGWPLLKAGDAYGVTRDAALEMTVQETNDRLAGLIARDDNWMFDSMLAALFDNRDSRTWTDRTSLRAGLLNIRGLANGDDTVYAVRRGRISGEEDTHYLAQADPIETAHDPFPNAADELREHPENAGEVVFMFNGGSGNATQLAVEALPAFIEYDDPNIDPASDVDRLIGRLGVDVPGEIIGYHTTARAWLVRWDYLPVDYILGTMTDSVGGATPLRQRNPILASQQGFRAVADRNDHPYYERQYERRAGFAAWNRVGAVIVRVGNGSYAIPTGFQGVG